MSRLGREQQILNKRSTKALMAVAFAAIAYGFASLAIDSGSWLEYFATFLFAVWAIKSAIHAVRGANH